LLFALFSWWPIIQSFVISFKSFDAHNPAASRWVGFENFRRVFVTDAEITAAAWRNMLLFVVLGIVVGYFLPVGLAILINEMRHANSLLRIVYYIPAVLPMVVVTLMWKMIFAPEEELLDA